jgi:hypothetical protein
MSAILPTKTETNQSDRPALPRLAYSMRETASILGVNYQTVYRLNKRGLLKSSGGLRTKLFPLAEIERFLKATAGGAH